MYKEPFLLPIVKSGTSDDFLLLFCYNRIMVLVVAPKRSNVIEKIITIRIQLFKKNFGKFFSTCVNLSGLRGLSVHQKYPALYHQSPKIIDR